MRCGRRDSEENVAGPIRSARLLPIQKMTEFTAEQKLRALERELRLRQQVYPHRVATHRMTQQQADYQIGIMQAILDDYQEAAKKERLL
jgi:hypothetical protein